MAARPLPVVETPRLALHRLTTDDAVFILELLNEPSFLRYIGDKGVRTREDACQYILAGPMASYERFGFGLLPCREEGRRRTDRDLRPAEERLARRRGRGVRLPAAVLVAGIRTGVRLRSADARAADLGPESDPGHHFPGQRCLDPPAGEARLPLRADGSAVRRTRRRSRCSRWRPDYSVSSSRTRRVSSAARSIDTPPSSRAFVASLPS